MKARQLRNSILQMAIQGKLVPQDPNDEPASVLLERIRAEKEKLVKEGKIKKDKNPSRIFRGADNTHYETLGNNPPVCIEDELPFEIPESWAWARLENIGNWQSGSTPPRNNNEYYGGNIPWLKTGDLNDGYINFTSETITDKALNERKLRLNPPGSILIAMYGATIGKLGILNIYSTTNQACCACLPMLISNKYLFYFLMSQKKGFVGQAEGGAQPNICKEKIVATLFPIPPLAEQNRIIAKIEELNPHIAEYDQKETELTRLNTDFPEALKKSILQEAVMGKLVPQNPDDEPASVLLERIRAEKEKLIAEGKIKRDKNESRIYRRGNSYYEHTAGEEKCINSELSFYIPESWEIIRLNDIGVYRKGPFGSSLTKSMFVPKGDDSVKVYEQKNAIQKNHTLGSYYINRKYYEDKMIGFTVEPGDIIVSCAGTIGETYVMPEDAEKGIINQALMRVRIYTPIDKQYFLLYFNYVIKQEAKKNSNGSAINNIPPFEKFRKFLLPIPPIEEQKRIVSRVTELINICERF